ncbi:MAG: hypothetical protein IKS12_07800 [Eubacterium sp.]|nr:hypothetical protein [Eubacterium sp.]
MAEKKFRAGLYAVISGILIAAVLTGLTLFAYTTRYTAFKPEKVAQFYVDTVIQTGDGYNAYKNTVLAQNKKLKYGDFIRRTDMVVFLNDGDDVKKADFVGTGSAEEQKAIDEVYNRMYEYYCTLVNEVGWDDYETFFMSYFTKLKEVRHEVYGDDYLDYEYMFGALEANVATYGESLTGAEEMLAADGKTVLREAFEGKYQKTFGKDYKFITEVKSCEELGADEVKTYVEGFKERIKPTATCGEAKADIFKLVDETEGKKKKTPKSDMIDAYSKLDCSDSISGVAKVECEVHLEDGKLVAIQELYVVKIGKSWYVDNTNLDTTGLYLAE